MQESVKRMLSHLFNRITLYCFFRFIHSYIGIGVIGSDVDLTYDYKYLGSLASATEDLAAGKRTFGDRLKNAKRPVTIDGVVALKASDGNAVLGKVQKLADKLRGQSGKCFD